MSHTNWHLSILDGHNNHVIIDVVHQVKSARLDLITLPSHTSHVWQQSYVSYFKSFKSAFRVCRDHWSIQNKGKGA